MEKNISSAADGSSHKVLPSHRELNDLVLSTKLNNLRSLNKPQEKPIVDPKPFNTDPCERSNHSSFIAKDFGQVLDEEKEQEDHQERINKHIQ